MENLIGGVDEAGRGPLIGDMFISLIVIDKPTVNLFKSINVKDSKKLSKEKRSELFKLIIGNAKGIFIHRITPQEIDRANINTLELEALCNLLKKAFTVINGITEVYIDAFSNIVSMKRYIAEKCMVGSNTDVKVVIEYGADERYIPVAAASIVSKVLRDSHIEILKRLYGDFGSGYPSDSRTIEWIVKFYKENRDIPPIVRRSWSTIEKVLGIPKESKKFFKKTLDSYL